MPRLICSGCGDPWPSRQSRCPNCGSRQSAVQPQQTIIVRNEGGGTNVALVILLVLLGLAALAGAGFGCFCCCLPAIAGSGS